MQLIQENFLDLLAEYHVKATFFVVADFAKKNPKLIERMKAEGHLIGLHSLEHKSAMLQTPFYTDYEFKESIKIMKALGVDVRYYRPPWGPCKFVYTEKFKKYNLKKSSGM